MPRPRRPVELRSDVDTGRRTGHPWDLPLIGASHSRLGEAVRLGGRVTRRPATDFFLRAESLFTAATYLDELAREDERLVEIEYDNADPVRLTQTFRAARERFLDQLFSD